MCLSLCDQIYKRWACFIQTLGGSTGLTSFFFTVRCLAMSFYVCRWTVEQENAQNNQKNCCSECGAPKFLEVPVRPNSVNTLKSGRRQIYATCEKTNAFLRMQKHFFQASRRSELSGHCIAIEILSQSSLAFRLHSPGGARVNSLDSAVGTRPSVTEQRDMTSAGVRAVIGSWLPICHAALASYHHGDHESDTNLNEIRNTTPGLGPLIPISLFTK